MTDRYSVTEDGDLYDAETGEVIGRADGSDPDAIVDDETAERALAIRLRIEGELAGLAAERKAILAQYHTRRRRLESRLTYWDHKHRAALEAYARTKLRNGERSAYFAHGTVKYRTCKGTHTIIDENAAVDWMYDRCPDRVKVTVEVNVKDVLELRGPDERLPFLLHSGPTERVVIETGVGRVK